MHNMLKQTKFNNLLCNSKALLKTPDTTLENKGKHVVVRVCVSRQASNYNTARAIPPRL